jgi:hypothetical protein
MIGSRQNIKVVQLGQPQILGEEAEIQSHELKKKLT